MTGTEHYREAEKLIGRAWHFTYGDGADVAVGHAFATMAQVHATLALAAATALAPVREMTQREWPAWCAVAATKNSHLGETQEAGRPATVNETPAGARDLEGGASSLRHVEEGVAVGTRADRPAPEPTWVQGDVIDVGNATLVRGGQSWFCNCGANHTSSSISTDWANGDVVVVRKADGAS